MSITEPNSGVPALARRRVAKDTDFRRLVRELVNFFTEEEEEAEHAEDEHEGFQKLENQLAHRKGVTDPAALAAHIGREKYGKKEMARKAAAGRGDAASYEEIEKAVRSKASDPHALAAWIKDRTDPGWRSRGDAEVKAAGVAVRSPEGRILFVKRGEKSDHAGEWALPGGALEEDETDEQAARRELHEETGYEAGELKPLHRDIDIHVSGDADVDYKTFLHDASSEFVPTLNEEHTEHRWASPSEPPSPLHPGVKALLGRDLLATDPPVSEKQRRAMWAAVEGHSTLGIPKSVGEKFVGHGHDDAATLEKSEVEFEHPAKGDHCCSECEHWRTGDRCELVKGLVFGQDWCNQFLQTTPLSYDHNLDPIYLALDKASVREYDSDGRLHVSSSNISKAAVNPYLGREIPGGLEMGLQGDKLYWLLRDPEELRRAASTFNGLPVVFKHVPTSAKDHPSDKVVGSTGDNATFEHPYLKNSLSIWPQDAIDGIEDATQRELSCGYHYRPDMTPGEYEGVHYDGIMRDIVGNHVALVKKGRAGSDVIVGDAAIELDDHATSITIQEADMPKTRLGAFVGGRLTSFFKTKPSRQALMAIDQAVGDLRASDLVARKPVIKVALKNIRDALAKDADLEGMHNYVDKLEKPAEDDPLIEDPNEVHIHHAEHNEEGEDEEEEPEQLKKLKAEDRAAIDAHFRKKYGRDESEEEEEKEEEKERKEGKDRHHRSGRDEPPDFPGKPKPGGKMVSQDEMNHAIAVAVGEANKASMARAKSVREAERHVEPWVGKLAVAYDTAEEVYRAALGSLGVSTKDVHESALPALLNLVPKPGRGGQASSSRMATDSMSDAGDFHTRFPGMKTARVI